MGVTFKTQWKSVNWKPHLRNLNWKPFFTEINRLCPLGSEFESIYPGQFFFPVFLSISTRILGLQFLVSASSSKDVQNFLLSVFFPVKQGPVKQHRYLHCSYVCCSFLCHSLSSLLALLSSLQFSVLQLLFSAMLSVA